MESAACVIMQSLVPGIIQPMKRADELVQGSFTKNQVMINLQSENKTSNQQTKVNAKVNNASWHEKRKQKQ